MPNFDPNLVDQQKQLRLATSTLFFDFRLDKISYVQKGKKRIHELLLVLLATTEGKKENAIFRNEKLLLDTIFLLCEWCQDILNGNLNANVKKNAAIANITLFDLSPFSYLGFYEDIVVKIKNLVKGIDVTTLEDVNRIVKLYLKLQHPTIAYLNSENTYGIDFKNVNEVIEPEHKMIIVSLEFYLQDTPWANPQVLKPKEIYTITGSLIFNILPKDFEIMKLLSATTFSEIFELKLNDIHLTQELEYKIEGTLLFKYAQSNFDDNISIKLVPYLIGKEKNELQPIIIGYDELNAKIIDQKNSLFQTGFETINKKVYEIYTNPLLSHIDLEEKNNFIKLLNGITNFQGYCLQSGMYKNVSSLKEEDFRNNLIQHLTAIPQIGENIIKESHVAGGRVEIVHKGYIAELKVETSISNRSKLMEKYSSQAVAYSSGNAKSVSIVCILDLTEKILPPGSPASNVIIKTPAVHGFEQDRVNNHFQVFVFIDGNTKSPSKYSK